MRGSVKSKAYFTNISWVQEPPGSSGQKTGMKLEPPGPWPELEFPQETQEGQGGQPGLAD